MIPDFQGRSMKVKIGKFSIGRDAIGRLNVLWFRTSELEGGGTNFSYSALRPYPPVYGRVISVTPRAFAEDPAILAEAFIRVARDAIETHKLLIKKGKRLRLESLQFFYTKPEKEHEPTCDIKTCPEQHTDRMNHMLAWKAMGR